MQATKLFFVLMRETIFRAGGKTMLLSGSRVSQFALFLSSVMFLAPLSQATPNVPPAQGPQTPLALTSQQQDQLYDLVDRVLKHADKAGCKKSACTILVANFTGSSGSTSILGMQLADEVSKQLASQQNAIQIIERSRLRDYLEQERISDTLLNNEKAMRWLGKQLGATAVLKGTTDNQGESVRLQVSLLSCDKDKSGPTETISFPDSDAMTDLAPVDSYAESLPSSNKPSVPVVLRAGGGGASPPSCSYCPNPSYSDPARAAKFNGTVIMAVTVSADGRTIEARVSRGAPYGLNDAAIRAVRSWQFKPAMHEGAPVSCTVMIEATFRLY
jgi:TonB family protein